MNSKWEKIYSALRTIKNNYGNEIVSEPVKVKNLLFDFVPELKNETKAFSNVLCDADINRYIYEHRDIQESYIIMRIENNMGLSSEWARYITKGLIILANHSELSIVTTQHTDTMLENKTTDSDSKAVTRKKKVKRIKRKKGFTVFWEYSKLVIGCIILLVAVVLGLYAWFTDTGLTIISYYLILAGISFLGMFFLLWFLDFEDLLGGIGTSIIIVICMLVGVSIIGLIGDLIIKLI